MLGHFVSKLASCHFAILIKLHTTPERDALHILFPLLPHPTPTRFLTLELPSSPIRSSVCSEAEKTKSLPFPVFISFVLTEFAFTKLQLFLFVLSPFMCRLGRR